MIEDTSEKKDDDHFPFFYNGHFSKNLRIFKSLSFLFACKSCVLLLHVKFYVLAQKSALFIDLFGILMLKHGPNPIST